MSNKQEILKPTGDLAIELMEIACPIFSIGKAVADWKNNVSDAILFDKLYSVLNHQDCDFNDWLKISEYFEKDSINYKKMIKQLIYFINAINEIEMVDVFSNLLRSYKSNLINKSDFFRLSFVLQNLLWEDAAYLESKIHMKKLPENVCTMALTSNNLMYMSVLDAGDAEGNTDNRYDFTKLAIMLDKYGISYGKENKYNYSIHENT